MRQGTGHGRRGAPPGGRPPGVRPAERATAPPRGSRSPVRGAHGFTAACGAALLLAGAAAPVSAAPAASGERDVQLVYCLAAAHRTDLVAAAVALGLLTPDGTAAGDSVRPVGSGGRMTLQRWAGQREDDFSRACSALMTSAAGSRAASAQGSGGEDGWFVTFLKGLPVLAVGALLTLGGQLSERVSSERRQSRQRLRTDEAAFRGAARAYLTAYEGDADADHTAVRSARETLTGTLFQVSGPGARRRAAVQAVEGLPLAEPLPSARAGTVFGTDGRAAESRAAGDAVNRVLRAVSDLDRGFAHWAWRTVREWRVGRSGSGAAV
ncbi:hypothetical protein ACFV0T_20750 [Streptomyces sp. NPDC059582]|uniref:hypothetical protein n=1 Tax=Streptomyces sp. NPDC059582 TaxID=3346875 RepID=UPI0036C7520C